jgi:hypothetical protein
MAGKIPYGIAHIYNICNMFASREKIKPNFKNLKTQNILLFEAKFSELTEHINGIWVV